MILKSMGVECKKDDMDGYAGEVDEEATGKFNFEMFCAVSAKFMIEDDEEQMKEELKEAFRIYDKEGQGFITNDVLKEILREIDPTLTENDLENIIEEVDEDGSGTMDFDEFQEMMMGWRVRQLRESRVSVLYSTLPHSVTPHGNSQHRHYKYFCLMEIIYTVL